MKPQPAMEGPQPLGSRNAISTDLQRRNTLQKAMPDLETFLNLRAISCLELIRSLTAWKLKFRGRFWTFYI